MFADALVAIGHGGHPGIGRCLIRLPVARRCQRRGARGARPCADRVEPVGWVIANAFELD